MATATTTPIITAVSTPPEPGGGGGTAGERGRGGGEGVDDGCGVNQHLAVPLTRYTETASECLTVSNAVPCNHTDRVSHSIHQRQSCHIPNKLEVCRSVKHHHCPIDGDLT